MGFKVNEDIKQAAEAETEFQNVPEGTYQCQIMEASEKLTSKQQECLSLRFRIMNGEYQDRLLFMTIVYEWDWAPSMMKSLCQSAGIDWDTVTEVTPELLTNRVCYIKTPHPDKEKYFVKPVVVEGEKTIQPPTAAAVNDVPW